MKTNVRVACRVAGVNPDRFNELVAAGKYPCAPQGRPGAPRMFDENDVIALRVYSKLATVGYGREAAARMACQLRAKLDGTEEYEDFRADFLDYGFGDVRELEVTIGNKGHSRVVNDSGKLWQVIGGQFFYIDSLREYVRHECERLSKEEADGKKIIPGSRAAAKARIAAAD